MMFLPSCVSSSAQDNCLEPVIEGNDLCWADKGEVEGVEEEHHILARIVGEADLHYNMFKGFEMRLLPL